jgi:hypothetical protein
MLNPRRFTHAVASMRHWPYNRASLRNETHAARQAANTIRINNYGMNNTNTQNKIYQNQITLNRRVAHLHILKDACPSSLDAKRRNGIIFNTLLSVAVLYHAHWITKKIVTLCNTYWRYVLRPPSNVTFTDTWTYTFRPAKSHEVTFGPTCLGPQGRL